ncbi:MAG: DUF362 domain-containing protein [Armatimonadetes bacterium]|nr:DUF362 domain-containing protein [Armatimonadota bacterium]
MAHQTDRRSFLGTGAALAAAGLLAGRGQAQAARSKVIVVTCPTAITETDQADAAAVKTMIDKGITALAGTDQVDAAWAALVKTDDKVALVDAGTWLMNVPAVFAEVARGIQSAKPAKLALAICKMTNNNAEYMGKLKAALEAAKVSADLIDPGLYALPCKFGDAFTLMATLPTVKAHPISGVSGAVKHYATLTAGKVSEYHANGMETAGKVLADEFGKHRHLTIIDGLRWGNGRKGPSFYRKCLLFSTDPVAADAVALKLFLENQQALNNIPPERHIQRAETEYKAGIADLARIDIVDLKV